MVFNPFQFDPSSPGQAGMHSAEVVDIDDPKKLGRVKLRFPWQHDIPVDKLAWSSVAGGTDNPNRLGLGKSNRLEIGSKVAVIFMGDQGAMLVLASIPNTQDPDANNATADLHLAKVKDAEHNRDDWKQKVYGQYEEDPKGAKPGDERRINQGRKQSPKTEGDPKKKSVGGGGDPEPRRFGNRRGAKSETDSHTPKTIGGLPKQQSDMLNATKYIDQTLGKKGELIPNSLKMVQQLQSTAKSGGVWSSDGSVGGAGNIAGALAGISQFVQTNSGQTQQQEQTLSLLERLLLLYKRLTGQDGRDGNGQLTAAFIQWRDEYLRENQGLV
jgi:hypothetical protein